MNRNGLIALLFLGVWACGDDPMPPVACGAIPQQTVTTGEQVHVAPCFEDPEMGALTLAAVSSNPEVATAEVVGDQVRIGAVSPGTAVITVTATDPDMLEGELSFEVLVPNRPPQLRGEIRLDAMHPGSTVQLVLSEHFYDPDGEELTYAATSSDTLVASVAQSSDTLAVTAVSPGTASVTVTATDPGGLSATARIEVLVRDNRPPVVEIRVRQQIYSPGTQWRTSVISLFSDPDGDALAYSAASSDTRVVSAQISGDKISVHMNGVGVATVTVTATDPHGLSATLEIVFKVVPNRLPFRDDFESDESLDGWALYLWNATAAFGDGTVRVTTSPKDTTYSGDRYAGLERRLRATNWTIRARMGNVTEDSWVQLGLWSWDTKAPVRVFSLQVGADPDNHWTDDDSNWRLFKSDDYRRQWEVIASGESDAVGGVGELVDVTLSHVGPTLSVVIGDSVVFRTTEFGHGDAYGTSNVNLEVWPAPGTSTPKTGVFDWVELTGTVWRTGSRREWTEVEGETSGRFREFTIDGRAPTNTPMARQPRGPARRGRRRFLKSGR